MATSLDRQADEGVNSFQSELPGMITTRTFVPSPPILTYILDFLIRYCSTTSFLLGLLGG